MVARESLTTIGDTAKSRHFRNLYHQAGSRFAQHYLKVAKRADAKLGGEETGEGLEMLDRELQNIRAGMECARNRARKEGWELVRGYSSTLVRFFGVRGMWQEWTEWANAGLKACERLGDNQGTAQTLCNLGSACYLQGEWERATELHEKSLEITERLGDSRGRATTWANMGVLYAKLGNPRQARELGQKALEVFEALGSWEAQRVREWLERLA